MTYDALIFDIDGTLWNASATSAKGWNKGLAKLGIDKRINAEQIGMVTGHPYEECVEMLLPGMGESYPELFKTLDKYETEAIKSEGGRFFEGVIEGMIELAGRYKIFLVSNCQEWYLRLFLDFSGLKHILAGTDCNGISGLPKNEMLLRLKRDYARKNPVYIGDTAGDEGAAKLAEMDFIFASWGFGKPNGSPTTVTSFAELLEHISNKTRISRF
jgi:phosphoglycolate phosphatase